jgi:hypothetical protein
MVRKVLPEISIEFSVRRKQVAKGAAKIMDGIAKNVRQGKGVQAFVRGWGKVSNLADELVSLMKDPAKVSRLEVISERALGLPSISLY